ncbi:MAG: diaminopimelate decarboxylase [bacterium]
MDFFNYVNGELFAEKVPLKIIADRFGTPLYVYSKNTLIKHLSAFKNAFKGSKALVCFAYKANFNRAILKIIKNAGFGADCVSEGELLMAKKIGIPGGQIVFNGNGKTEDEIKLALGMKVKMFNVDSVQELFTISRIAKKLKVRPDISFRVNPEIEIPTHPHIATALKGSKFGIPMGEAFAAYKLANSLGSVAVSGVHMHIGSQITAVEPFKKALEKLFVLSGKLRKAGIRIKYVNVGGGLGVKYHGELPAALKKYADVILRHSKRIAPNVILEPGRVIIANTAVLVTKVIANKTSGGRKFIVADCGMNDLLRPSMYGAYHEVEPVRIFENRGKEFFTVAGPVCESGDIVAKRRFMQAAFPGELLAVRGVGAYGYSMSSNYNLRPRPAEVLVDGKKFFEIRKREKTKDLI